MVLTAGRAAPSNGRGSAARRRRIGIKILLWAVLLAPAVTLGAEAALDRLGANPIEEVTHRTGWWALCLLACTLAITPLRRWTGRNELVRYRRLVGLFAFFYATLHFLSYLVLDQFFAWTYIAEDIAERPFITVGFTAWLILVSLAATSTRGAIRRLGKRWQRLHRLVYVAALLGGIHYLWKVKADTRAPLVFLSIIGVLLGWRIIEARRRGKRSEGVTATRPSPT